VGHSADPGSGQPRSHVRSHAASRSTGGDDPIRTPLLGAPEVFGHAPGGGGVGGGGGGGGGPQGVVEERESDDAGCEGELTFGAHFAFASWTTMPVLLLGAALIFVLECPDGPLV